MKSDRRRIDTPVGILEAVVLDFPSKGFVGSTGPLHDPPGECLTTFGTAMDMVSCSAQWTALIVSVAGLEAVERLDHRDFVRDGAVQALYVHGAGAADRAAEVGGLARHRDPPGREPVAGFLRGAPGESKALSQGRVRRSGRKPMASAATQW